MYTQERTAMANLVVGGPVAVNSYDNAIVAALVENRPVMLVHAFNGGYLRPAELAASSHDKGVKLATALDPATKDAQGHLWHITPGGFFGQRPLYYIESAAARSHPRPPARPRPTAVAATTGHRSRSADASPPIRTPLRARPTPSRSACPPRWATSGVGRTVRWRTPSCGSSR